MHFVIFFPCFLFKFYVIFTKFLKVSGTWKYFIKFSYLVGLNFISIIDRWNYLSLYQYMSWAGGCRTPMTIYKLEKPWFLLHWLGTNFCLVLPQLLNVLPWVLICLSSNFNFKIHFLLVILHNSRWSRKFSDLNGSESVPPFSNASENSIIIAVNFLFVRRSHLGKFDVKSQNHSAHLIAEYIFPLLPQYSRDRSLETLHFHDHHHQKSLWFPPLFTNFYEWNMCSNIDVI